MNGSLNALFRPSDDPVKQKENRLPQDQAMAPVAHTGRQKAVHRPSEGIGKQPGSKTPSAKLQRPQITAPRPRKERADKKKDIKFPVTPKQREELRRLAKELRIEQRDPSKKYETISNTHLLKKALEQQSIFPERFPPLVYKDTGQYMHAEPLLADFGRVEELSLKWNLSLRKTVYRLIMNIIYRGEVDCDAYRAGR